MVVRSVVAPAPRPQRPAVRAAGRRSHADPGPSACGAGYTAFGQTAWSLDRPGPLRGRSSPCAKAAGADVLSLMNQVVAGQRWGLCSTGQPSAVQGRLGTGDQPGRGDGWLDRQMGVIRSTTNRSRSRWPPRAGDHGTGTQNLTADRQVGRHPCRCWLGAASRDVLSCPASSIVSTCSAPALGVVAAAVSAATAPRTQTPASPRPGEAIPRPCRERPNRRGFPTATRTPSPRTSRRSGPTGRHKVTPAPTNVPRRPHGGAGLLRRGRRSSHRSSRLLPSASANGGLHPRHYGGGGYRLLDPQVIVQHFTSPTA